MSELIFGAALNPKQDIYGQAGFFAGNGFGYIDLALDFPLACENFDQERLAGILRRAGIPLHGQTPVLLPFASPHPAIRKNAAEVAAKAANALAKAGAKNIVLHPDCLHSFLPADTLIDWNIESFRGVRNQAPGCSFLLENLSSGAFSLPENLHAILDGIPGLEVALDAAHAHICHQSGGPDLDDFFRLPVAHVHISDNDGSNDSHLPPGKGRINWRKLLSALRGHYDGNVTIEAYAGSASDVVDSLRLLKEMT